MATATSDPVRLPPGPPIPKMVQGIVLLTALQYRMFPTLSRRYGSTFTVNVPFFGKTVVVSDPILVKDVFSTADDLIERPTKILGQAFGPGSTFSLTGEEHAARRKLVLPAFHTKRARTYEHIVEEEVRRETANWPEGREFETLPSMTRLTLNSILRAVFGEEGPELDELRSLMPPMITIGSLLHLLPEIVGRDFGRWSPGARLRRDRRRFDAVIDVLIAKARADPALAERSDVLAILLQARYENGEPISDRHIADELLTVVAAGHETTASQLAWAVERMCRHPQLLSRLADEADAGGSELRQATIFEVQRTRSTIEAALRCTKTRIRLDEWVLPADTNIMVNFQLAHESDENFPEADSFNPDRFLGASPKPFRWIPYGGGVNRCVGAGFAAMEMDVTLRTLLREFRFAPTDAPDEGRNYRGVAIAPRRGARAVVHRRTAAVSRERDSWSAATQRMAATDYITDIGVRLFKAVQNNYWYPFLTRRLEAEDLTCLNYGYEEESPMGLPLAVFDEPNRLGIQLYHRVATQAELDGKQVLEVSCGHGGGAAYLVRALRPASYTGLDFNSDGIAYCRRRHDLPGLDFVHGDAESLPFADESFDAVINVEASHTYPRLSRFLAEVARVLRPGGRFLYADFRGNSEFPGWEAALADTPMRQVSKRVINSEVLRGLNKSSQRSIELVERLLPGFLRPFGRRFAGVPGTGLYHDIESGKIEYRMYCFAKD